MCLGKGLLRALALGKSRKISCIQLYEDNGRLGQQEGEEEQ